MTGVKGVDVTIIYEAMDNEEIQFKPSRHILTTHHILKSHSCLIVLACPGE